MSIESHEHGYEVRDVSVRPLVLWAGVLLSVVIGSYFLVSSLNQSLRRERQELSPLFIRPDPVEPKLVAKPREELRQHRALQRSQVDGYGWVEPQHIARGPVRRGMEILLERGVPVRGTPDSPGGAK